ncbi:MAG: aminoacyl-tRNA hydrolase [Sporomusaceae bacterium]|nr:aminoacyl-tRNA hydrolase [Sporomusaceae bacterium]
MKLIVGLGNPGSEYSATRHNAGFLAIDELARRWGVDSWRSRNEAVCAEYRDAGETVLLVKPQTYMNLSGVAVGELMRWYKLTSEDIIVIYDDLDLPVGKLRLRPQGGAGGHKGIESLLIHLGSEAFARIRIGIGRPPVGWETAKYVLGRFTQEEAPLLATAIARVAEAVECILQQGFVKAMNLYSK